jgi:hypothetical protein
MGKREREREREMADHHVEYYINTWYYFLRDYKLLCR